MSQKALKWLVAADESGVAHEFVKEACIQKVQNGMFDAADVLVDFKPVVGFVIEHGAVIGRTGIARVVPAGFHKGVEGVRFPGRGRLACGAGHLIKPGHVFDR